MCWSELGTRSLRGCAQTPSPWRPRSDRLQWGAGRHYFSSGSRRGQSRRRGRDAIDRGHAAARDLVGAIVTGHAYRRGGGTGGRGSGDGTRRGVNRRTVFSDPPSWNALRSGPGVGAAGDGRAAAADSPPLSDQGSAPRLGGFSRTGAGCEGGAVDDPTARSRAPRRWPTATRFVGEYSRAPLSPPPPSPPKNPTPEGFFPAVSLALLASAGCPDPRPGPLSLKVFRWAVPFSVRKGKYKQPGTRWRPRLLFFNVPDRLLTETALEAQARGLSEGAAAAAASFAGPQMRLDLGAQPSAPRQPHRRHRRSCRSRSRHRAPFPAS